MSPIQRHLNDAITSLEGMDKKFLLQYNSSHPFIITDFYSRTIKNCPETPLGQERTDMFFAACPKIELLNILVKYYRNFGRLL